MKHLFIVLFCLLFLSLACALTGQSTQTADDSAIATVVAQTLAAQPSNTQPPTLQPSLTSQPVVSTPTQTTTITSTTTPTVTATPTTSTTSEPSQTPTPSGPKANLGNPTWSTSFDKDKSGFFTESDDQIQFKVEKSGLWVTATMKNIGWHGWSFQNRKVADFYLEGTFVVGNCGGMDQYGLAFRAPDYSSGYFFGVTCDGQYNLRTLTSDFSIIVDWTDSDAVLYGSNQVNRLGVMVKGNHISLYINDKLVKEIDDTSFQKEGTFGVYIAAYQTPGFTYKLDEIAYWKLD